MISRSVCLDLFARRLRTRVFILLSVVCWNTAALPAFAQADSTNLTADDGMRGLIDVLATTDDDALRLDVLRGMAQGLKGRRDLPMPANWNAVETNLGASSSAEVRVLAQTIGLRFGSVRASAALRATFADTNAPVAARAAALESLLAARDPELPRALQVALAGSTLRPAVLRALGAFDAPGTAEAVLGVYSQLSPAERRDALATLASRAAYAPALVMALRRGVIPAADLSAEFIRQLRALNHAELTVELERVWGAFRDIDADKRAEVQRYRAIYRAGGSQPGDAVRGRVVFARVCQQCHTLFGTGGSVGPDITGANRGDLEYLLQNMVDPNAVLPNEYRASTVETRDGRSLTGLVTQQDQNSVTLATATETLVLARQDVRSVALSELSMMPEGLLAPLADQEVRDLLYYLSRPGQVPLLATAETVGGFFNRKDLTGWDGTEGLWRVEDGEIVGRSTTGLARNEFLASQLLFSDFRLVVEVKLLPNKENSGIQVRSEAIADSEMRGYQADIGAGWWGKLYEEHGRGLLWDRPGDAAAVADGWNRYEILVVGHRIRTAINGKLCVDLEDPSGGLRGVVGLQLRAGGPLEVRFRNFEVELDPTFELRTLR
jgi:putative heme-binding domain-containing protein